MATMGCAIFDLDGTLIDSAPLCAEIMNSMLADHASPLRLTHNDARPFITRGGAAMISGLVGSSCGAPEMALAEFRNRYAAAITPEASLYPNVVDGLKRLHSLDIVLAICSNKPTHLCEKVLDELGLRYLFATVVGAQPNVPLKPDPSLFRLALRGSGGNLGQCCYVGDSEVDYKVARWFSIPYVMVTYGYGDYARVWPGARTAADFTLATEFVIESLAMTLGSRGILAS